MIGIIFQFGTEIVEVRLDRTNCFFRTKESQGALVPLDNLKIDYVGVCKEFPDLELRDDWRQEAIKRFKDKLNNMKDENERVEYLIADFKKYGYIPLYKQRDGHRPEKIEVANET